MIRIALIVVVAAIVAGAAVMVTERLMTNRAGTGTPSEPFGNRFPDGWESAPVVEYKKPPPPWPSAVSRLSADEFAAAVTALERLRPQPRPPQPADAVFNDAQIASIKGRLKLTREQEAYWQPVEATLRQVVWDRRGGRARVDAASLARFQEAAGPFLATLSGKQQSEIQALANIIGLRLNLSAAQ